MKALHWFLSISCCLAGGLAGQRAVAQLESNLNPCDGVSYIYTADGQCADLTFMTRESTSTTIARITETLGQIGINVIDGEDNCSIDTVEGPTTEGTRRRFLLGFYDPDFNHIVMCTQNLKETDNPYADTLVHETWHAIQDCVAGLDNSLLVALVERYPDDLRRIIRSVRANVPEVIDLQYPEEQHVIEAEARYFQDKPKVVLAALEACQTIAADNVVQPTDSSPEGSEADPEDESGELIPAIASFN